MHAEPAAVCKTTSAPRGRYTPSVSPANDDETVTAVVSTLLTLVLCSQSLFRFADLGDDGLCRGGPDKGCGVIVSPIDVVVDRLD